jgi:heme iron utilization protein
MNIEKSLRMKLDELFENQKFCILATSLGDMPHTSIVAFAVCDDLKAMLFATPTNTAKYSNLKANPNVAVFFDNRSNSMSDFYEAVGVTAYGTAAQIDTGGNDTLVSRYLEKNPNLEQFLFSDDCAVFRVELKAYHIVENFQQVTKIELS